MNEAEVIQWIRDNPEKIYDNTVKRIRNEVTSKLNGKQPWDYPGNRQVFEIRDKRTGLTFPM